MNRPAETRRNVKYDFSDKEKLEMGAELGSVDSQIKQLVEEKKASNTQHQSRIDEKEARRSLLSSCLRDGFEFRDMDCTIIYNSPKDGVKQIVRKDRPEVVVEELPMTPQEMQEELDLENGDKGEGEDEEPQVQEPQFPDVAPMPPSAQLDAKRARDRERKRKKREEEKKQAQAKSDGKTPAQREREERKEQSNKRRGKK